jgi:diadenosine tetraphosphate (Ap4A) HIT family hydrolase
MDCVFCDIDSDRIAIENETAYAVFDAFPVNKGHMLIIPKKHIKDYFETDLQTQNELWKLVDECKKIVDKEFKPDGYNIGINCGEAAGQTVMHLHIHLIPRYKGDIENPRGGVRGVIPEKRIY